MWQILKELIVALPRGIRRYFTTEKLLKENETLKAEKKDLQTQVEILRQKNKELEDLIHSNSPKVDSNFNLHDPDDN